MGVLLTGTETCPLYPARYIYQTTQLAARESVRFVSVLIPHSADESPHAIASSLRAAYEPRSGGGGGGGGGYTVSVSLRFGGVDLTARIDGVGEEERVRKTVFFEPSIYQNDRFTKTGSVQTWGKHSKIRLFS
jgi:hypothetical protein